MMTENEIRDDMNSLKLITLYREAVHQPDPSNQDTGSRRQLMLTMDYFDALEVKSFSLKDNDIRAFFGQDIGEKLSKADIAMHSIPLYCPQDVFKQDVAKHIHYGDPFKNDNKADFLCFIQVYITPEVLRRLDIYKGMKENLHEAVTKTYDCFYRDLHEIMENYITHCLYEVVSGGSKECKDPTFCYCIYQSLSIGDYMIGISCNNLDYVFQIMEAVRRRKFTNISGDVKNEDSEALKSLILYKTYTIVSINDSAITRTRDHKSGKNHYILRVVLSNNYRNHENEIIEEYKKDSKKIDYRTDKAFKWLHGRYNFSVELNENAFLYLFKTIIEYKLDRIVNITNPVSLGVEEKKICDLLIDFLKKHYISHLNERCMIVDTSMNNDSWSQLTPEVQPFCDLIKTDKCFSEAINGKIENVRDKIEDVFNKVKELNTSRSTIGYNMRLLKRLTNTCSAINGYADSRVYAVIIIRLIEAVLNGVEEYQEYFKTTYDHTIIKHIDFELNTAVSDLNTFSNYILENSLQSLQAPDYNLESHISVEKLMMSYSAFLQRVIDWYGRSDFAKDIDGLQERYVTIMVPKSLDNGLSTKALFFRVNNKIADKVEKLLVVYCPSFYALTDFAGSMGRLLHELAHYLRYEKRGVRNDLIISYSAGLLFNQLGTDMVERFLTEVGNLQDTVKIQELLDNCFKSNFINYLKKNISDDQKNYQNMKLLTLIEEIEKCYLNLIKAVSYLGTLKRHIEKYVRSNERSTLTNEDIDQLWNFYKAFFDKEGDQNERVRKQQKVRKKLTETLKKKLAEEEEMTAVEAASGLYDALYNIQPEISEDKFYKICMGVTDFLKDLEKSAEEAVDKYQNTPDGRKISRFLNMGYYRGLSNTSLDFMEFVQKSIPRTKINSLGFWTENLYLYREVASDLFMVKTLGLTTFGYLNFCSRYIPADGILDRAFVSRMALTIYAMNEEEYSELHFKWPEVFHAMCCYIGNSLYKALKTVKDKKLKDLLKEPVEGMDYFATNPVEGEQMLKLVDKWGMFLLSISKEEKIKTDERLYGEIVHCRFLCRNFVEIGRRYSKEMGSIEWSRELAADLAGGGKVLGRLHEELKKDKTLWKYCGLIRDTFNEPKGVYQETEEAFDTQNITEFVLSMHYEMIFSNLDKFNCGHVD